MARYALRNQKKITNAFGKDYTELLLKSLDFYFANAKYIEEHDYEGENYKIIHANNVQPNTDSYFEFYLIEKKFDVYRLAYKSAAG